MRVSDRYSVQRGTATWRRRYEGAQHVLTVVGEGSPCEHDQGECEVAELWPLDGETDEQFKARLRAKFSRIGATAS